MTRRFEAIVMGASAGGMHALECILTQLPQDFALAVLVVQHQRADADNFLEEYLDRMSAINVKEACLGEAITGGNVYISPPGYHLQVEENRTISLSTDLPVNFSIPSIDILFETAADLYEEHLVGVILTGASVDGSQGMRAIKASGGLTGFQDPATAEAAMMPGAAIEVTDVDHILALEKIGGFLRSLVDE